MPLANPLLLSSLCHVRRQRHDPHARVHRQQAVQAGGVAVVHHHHHLGRAALGGAAGQQGSQPQGAAGMTSAPTNLSETHTHTPVIRVRLTAYSRCVSPTHHPSHERLPEASLVGCPMIACALRLRHESPDITHPLHDGLHDRGVPLCADEEHEIKGRLAGLEGMEKGKGRHVTTQGWCMRATWTLETGNPTYVPWWRHKQRVGLCGLVTQTEGHTQAGLGLAGRTECRLALVEADRPVHTPSTLGSQSPTAMPRIRPGMPCTPKRSSHHRRV